MKNIVIAGAMLLAVSCQDDFLDKNPLDQISSETFWNSEDEVVMALAGCYQRLQSDFLTYNRAYLDCMADNGWADNKYSINNLSLGNLFPTSGSAIRNLYETPYRGISSCNFFLDNVDKAPLDEATLNRYKGEARFLRAMMYFDLLQSFGGVVVYKTSPLTDEEVKIPKSSEDDVLAFILEDLDFAITHLNNVAYQGHAVEASARALKARVLMFDGQWEAALPELEAVMSSELFSLSDDYQGLFLSKSQEGNPEIIFSTKYLSPNSFHANSQGADNEFGWWALIQPYQNLVDVYECTDGQPIDESPLYDEDNPYENRDPRLDMSMKLPGEVWYDGNGNVWETYIPRTGYVLEKYVELQNAPFSQSMANKTDHDFVHIRYADVLLMYAEAKNEVDGPGDSVYDALDEVRGRVGVEMPPVDRVRYASQTDLREYIRQERRVELAFEGHRYFDLKRWRTAHIVIPAVTNPAGVPHGFEMRHYKMPFQVEELDLNPNLKQNDGY